MHIAGSIGSKQPQILYYYTWYIKKKLHGLHNHGKTLKIYSKEEYALSATTDV